MIAINYHSEERIKKVYNELADNFIKKHFGNPVVRLPFYFGYINKTKLGEILTLRTNDEDVKFMDIYNLPFELNDSFRKQLLKVGVLEGIKFVLFYDKDRTLYLDIIPSN